MGVPLERVLLALAGSILVACGEARPVLGVEGGSLVLRAGDLRETLLRAKPPDRGRSGADVLLVHEVLAARGGSRFVVQLTVGGRELVLPVRLHAGGGVSWGAGICVPWATRVLLSPGGDRFLLVSTRDLRLPQGSPFLLNRGAMLVSFEDRPFRAEPGDVLHSDDPGPWYGAPEARYVPPGEFEVESVAWESWGCRLVVREEGGSRRVVVLPAPD